MPNDGMYAPPLMSSPATPCHSARSDESRSGVAQTSSCDVCERRAMTYHPRCEIAHMPNCGMYAPPAPPAHQNKHASQKTLTPNDQSARLFISMGEGRFALAV